MYFVLRSGHMDAIHRGYNNNIFTCMPWGHWFVASIHWVMRQFGISQHIPNYVDTGDELHDISFQGNRQVNWLLIHAAYLDMWHGKIDHICGAVSSDRSSKLHEMVHVDYAPIYYTYFVAFYNTYTYSSNLRVPSTETKSIGKQYLLKFIQFLIHIRSA